MTALAVVPVPCLLRRIEVMFRVKDPKLQARMVEEILPIILADNVKVRLLVVDSNHARLAPRVSPAVLRVSSTCRRGNE